jgi:signal transduction histidine kinase
MVSRSSIVYGLLLAAWVIVVGWQAVEHHRVKAAARSALVHRARDITGTLGMVMKAQRRFVRQDQMESALQELVKSDELVSIAIISAAGNVVALAGAPIDPAMSGAMEIGEHWESDRMTLVNPFNLGENVSGEGERDQTRVILPRREPGTETSPDRPPPPMWAPRRPDGEWPSSTNEGQVPPSLLRRSDDGDRSPGGRERRWPFRPSFRMSDEEYKALIEKQGSQGFVIVMATQSIRAASVQDFWVRWWIGCFSAASAVGLAIAWRTFERSSELQMRLVRASQLNSHLREMNLAAAGLAHETRNPLNIIRGLSQMISRQAEASPDIRAKSAEIAEEVDQISSQLNEFIDYSKPRELRRASVDLGTVIGDVDRALQSDLEDKEIHLKLQQEELIIDADQQMLRQLLFNLLINAIQAVPCKGEIEVVPVKVDSSEVLLEFRDNGPGVAPENRTEIFRPYFTTRKDGTGLGLAVVHQIVAAHGWEIDCLPNSPQGTIFRVSRIKRLVK